MGELTWSNYLRGLRQPICYTRYLRLDVSKRRINLITKLTILLPSLNCLFLLYISRFHLLPSRL